MPSRSTTFVASEAPSLRSRVRSLVVDTRLSRLAAPVHRELTRAQLLGARYCDAWLGATEPCPASDARRVTAIVKAFERPAQLRILLESVRRLFPEVAVIVADDSRCPASNPGVKTIALPYDVGVSAGRQAALAAVQTELTWVLDDDFVLYRGTRLARVVRALDHYPSLDIIGGPVVDLPLFTKQPGPDGAIYPTAAEPVLPLGSRLGSLVIRDKVPNFFVARSERLRLVGWDSTLKRLDHGDFFTRARGVLATAYDDEFRCFHAQTPFDREYMRHRRDIDADAAILQARYFT